MRAFLRLPGRALALAMLFALVVTGADARAANLPTGFQDTTVFEGLSQPTTFKFAPGGEVFVALKSGEIVVYENLLDTTPELFADLRKPVYDNGDHGLLGLALDPNFSVNHYVYALYTYDHVLGKTLADGEEGKFPRWGESPTYEGDPCPEPANAGCPVSGRLVRLVAEGGHAAPSAAKPTEDVLIEDWCQQFSSHSIGDLHFGPEGALFVSGGEGASFTASDYGQFGNRCGDPQGDAGENLSPPSAEGGSLRSQSVRSPSGRVSLDGTLLRVDPNTGEGWAGNPFASSGNANARRIVAYGFRNPFRFALNSRTNEVFVNNVGYGTDEEIDRLPVQPAQAYNSGWPCFEGLGRNPGFEGLGLSSCEGLYHQPGSTSSPFFYYDHSTVVAPGDPCPTFNGSAISGSAFYEGSEYPAEYDDAFFFADSVRGCIYVMYADADGDPDPLTVAPFLSNTDPYPGVDIEQGPEGNLYYASLYGSKDGTIHRISYDPGAPQAQLEVDPEWGPASQVFNFDASNSTDPGGNPLTYAWDFNEDGTFEVAGGETQSKNFNVSENETVAVKVSDEVTHKSSIAKVTVYPGDSPPKIEFLEPSSGFTWAVNEPIKFKGSAKAKEGGGAAIPLTGLYWKTRLLHCPFGPTMCHEHPLQVFPARESGEFPAPDHDYPSYLNISLTATDSRGLSKEQSVKIAARPVSLRFASSPPGITLTAGTKTAPAPFELLAIENSPTTIIAPSTAVVGGVTYGFQGWSDGGARAHTVVASGAAKYTAIYSGPEQPSSSSRSYEPPKLHKHPAKQTTSRSARFVFGAASGLRFRCRIDGKAYASCKSPRVYRHLKPGKHSFRVQALSAGEPVTKVTKFSWRILRGSG